MNRAKKQFKVYQEDAKLRQTSHWDWDYMNTEELDAAMQDLQRRDELVAQAKSAGSNAQQKKPTLLQRILGNLIR